MILDAVKRLLGLNSGGASSSQHQETHSPHVEDTLIPYRKQLPPDISEIESEFSHIHEFMEQQMRTMMGSFGFMFGSPFAGFGFGDDYHEHQNRSFPFSKDILNLPGSSTNPESIQPSSPTLEPRDEVLKPQFRSKCGQEWTGQDNVLDERLNEDGVSSVIDMLKPYDNRIEKENPSFSNILNLFGNGLFGGREFGFGAIPDSGSIMSSSTVTIYSNVNGHKSVEKIIRHPDGSIERTVIEDNGNPVSPQ